MWFINLQKDDDSNCEAKTGTKEESSSIKDFGLQSNINSLKNR